MGNIRGIDCGHTKTKHADFLGVFGRSGSSGGRAIAVTPRGVFVVIVIPSPPPSTASCWHSILKSSRVNRISTLPYQTTLAIVCSTLLDHHVHFDPSILFSSRSNLQITLTTHHRCLLYSTTMSNLIPRPMCRFPILFLSRSNLQVPLTIHRQCLLNHHVHFDPPTHLP